MNLGEKTLTAFAPILRAARVVSGDARITGADFGRVLPANITGGLTWDTHGVTISDSDGNVTWIPYCAIERVEVAT